MNVSILLAAAVAASRPTPAPDVVLYRFSDSRGTVFEYRLTFERLHATPRWSPDKELPLDIAAATAIAKKELKAARPQDIAIVEVSLSVTAVDSPATEYRWFYKITGFDKEATRGPTPPNTPTVMILMDGSVVRPIAGP